jgi:hypothetical protein
MHGIYVPPGRPTYVLVELLVYYISIYHILVYKMEYKYP